jgi:hypothetical protein
MIVRTRIEEKHLLPSYMSDKFEEECIKLNPSSIDQYELITVYLTSPKLEDDLRNKEKLIEKYRIRYYPEVRVGFNTRIFAEIKSKDGYIRHKRVEPISAVESISILQGDYSCFNGIDASEGRLGVVKDYRELKVKPVLIINYTRKVFMYGKTRVTIDSDISTKAYGDTKFKKLYENKVIVEFKYSYSMSSEALKLKERLPKQQSVSKYKSAREYVGIT